MVNQQVRETYGSPQEWQEHLTVAPAQPALVRAPAAANGQLLIFMILLFLFLNLLDKPTYHFRLTPAVKPPNLCESENHCGQLYLLHLAVNKSPA